MDCTRFKNDKEMIQINQTKDLAGCRYMLNVPGNGLTPDYIEDPHIRLQKFGANISSNIIDINTNLMGINRRIGRDCPQTEYTNCGYSEISYPNNSETITDQSRTMNPAWELRDLEKDNWDHLHHNPQNHTEMIFANNISTRINEKDNFEPKYPCIN